MPVPIRRALIVVLAIAALVIVVTALWLLTDRDEGDRTIPAPDAAVVAPVDAAPKDAATVADTTVAADIAVDLRKKKPWRKITPRRLRRLQRQHSGLFSLCLKRAARVSGNLPRKVNVVMHLKAGGGVKSVNVTPASSPALRRCLVRTIRAMRFPSDSKAQRLAFPIVFAR